MLTVAPTGTGKTLVYLLPLWKAIPKPSHSLILVPTRELGYQVSQMLQALDPEIRNGLALCVGGHDLDSQLQSLGRGWHTVIATPGRLLDALGRMPGLLNGIRILILDEFDRLIDMGFESQLASILAQLPNSSQRQTLLFSATGEEEVLSRLPQLMPANCPRYHVPLTSKAELLERFYFLKSNRKKNELLLEALEEFPGQAIVFVANREKANHVNGLLRLRGITSEALHGDRLQKERARAYQGFKENRFRVLIATDLASRGLDIPEMGLIINLDLPRTYRDYIHRSGRTARRFHPGTCLSFAGPDDLLPLKNLEKGFLTPLPCHPAYAQRDTWFVHAQRVHAAKVKREKQTEFIHREQGLSPEN